MAFTFAASPSLLGLAALGIVALAWLVVNTFVSYRKLRHIPGPWLARISQLWLFNVTFKGDLYLAMEDVIQKYGMDCKNVFVLVELSVARLAGDNWPQHDHH